MDHLKEEVRSLKSEADQLRKDRDEWKAEAEACHKILQACREVASQLEIGSGLSVENVEAMVSEIEQLRQEHTCIKQMVEDYNEFGRTYQADGPLPPLAEEVQALLAELQHERDKAS